MPGGRDERPGVLVEHAGEAFVELDADGRLHHANARFQELLGHPESEILGKDLFELAHAEDREATRALHRQGLGGRLEGALVRRLATSGRDEEGGDHQELAHGLTSGGSGSRQRHRRWPRGEIGPRVLRIPEAAQNAKPMEARRASCAPS